jgi:hypothetical protein
MFVEIMQCSSSDYWKVIDCVLFTMCVAIILVMEKVKELNCIRKCILLEKREIW